MLADTIDDTTTPANTVTDTAAPSAKTGNVAGDVIDAADQTLAFTGGSAGTQAGVAIAGMLVGFALIVFARRRRANTKDSEVR